MTAIEREMRKLCGVGCIALALVPALVGCPAGRSAGEAASTATSRAGSTNANRGDATMTLKIGSPAFAHQSEIPRKYTCEGEDTSPPLEWTGVPANAKSLALIVDDPDAPDPAAPKRTWVHWVLFAIPPTATGVVEGAGTGGELPAGTRSGKNDWQRKDYGGPCPPIGRHRYFHKLYALDFVPELHQPTKAELLQAIEGHILAEGELVGTYQKQAR